MTERIKIFFAWVKSFWERPVAEPAKAEEAKVSRPKRKYNKEKSKTLSDLLDNLEYTFEAMKIDYDEISLMGKSEIEGLKKFGVSVIPNALEGAAKTSKINDGIGLPSIIFFGSHRGREGGQRRHVSRFLLCNQAEEVSMVRGKKDRQHLQLRVWVSGCGF